MEWRNTERTQFYQRKLIHQGFFLCPAALRPPSPTRNALVSPVRRTMSVDGLVSFTPTSSLLSIEDIARRLSFPEAWPDPLPLWSVKTKVEVSSAKKEKMGMSMAKKQQRQLEKEVHFTKEHWDDQTYHWLVLLCCISPCSNYPHSFNLAVTGRVYFCCLCLLYHCDAQLTLDFASLLK